MTEPVEESKESASEPKTLPHSGRPRHRWFPALVFTGAAARIAWLWRSDLTQDYINVKTLATIVVALFAVSVWFALFGGRSKRIRWLVVGMPWLTFAALVLCIVLGIVRPVFDGDMAVVGWRLAFVSDADQRLDELRPRSAVAEWQTTPNDYPRFLGNGYWPEVAGVQLDSDWQTRRPEEVWRREIGAGWSAFAVVGNYAVTQEQRGEWELVTCYRVDDGQPVWKHRDRVRFDPNDVGGSMGGPGPRATPTLHDAKVFTQGATGLINCLDARTGSRLWSHNPNEELGIDVVMWGMSGSPLVVDDMVVVSVGSPDDATARDAFDSSLVAYDIETGGVRWSAGNRQAGYASPVLATLGGEWLILVVNEGFLTAHRASDGRVLWEFPWGHEHDVTASVSQPIPVVDDRVFLSKGYGIGAALLQVSHSEDGGWQAQPLWSPAIKPVMKTKFTNVVVRDGFVYGLDGGLLECIDLETGHVQWKERRRPELGHGQIILVGDTILILSEHGEQVLVAAAPDEYCELASMQVLDEGDVTWNNPAFAPPYLLVRNGCAAACFRMPLK